MKAENISPHYILNRKLNGVEIGNSHDYIIEAMEEHHQSQLQALAEEVEKKIEMLKRQGKHSNIYNYDEDCTRSIIAYLEGVLNLITNMEDK